MKKFFQRLEIPDVGSAKKSFSRRWNFCAAGMLILAGCAGLDEQVVRQTGHSAASMGALATQVTGEVARATVVENPPAAPATLNLPEALRLAARHNRELQAAREALYLDTLSLFGSRRDFEFALAGSVGYILNKNKDGETGRGSAQLTAQRKLPTGGTVSITGDASQQDQRPDGEAAKTAYSSGARIRLDQPLLAGAGYEASRAPLIQAERSYVYSLRDFVLKRQDQALQVMREYYGLLQAKRVQENNKLNVAQVTFLRQRSEAMFKVSRAPAIDVLRSQQEELSAVNRLQSGAESYAIQVRRFLLFLGLSSSGTVEVQDDIPEVKSLEVSESLAWSVARARRLDLISAMDRVADEERNLRVARNAYLPQLGVFGEAGLEGVESERVSGQDYDSVQSAGVKLELPLDRRDERDAVKRAALSVNAARRAWQEKLDQVQLEIASSLSELRTQRTTVELEARNIEVAEKRARNASLRFRNGELSNRDVLEAENDLLNARNAWGQARVSYELQRVQFLRNLGLLDVAEDGTLVELPFPEPDRVIPVAPPAVPEFEVME